MQQSPTFRAAYVVSGAFWRTWRRQLLGPYLVGPGQLVPVVAGRTHYQLIRGNMMCCLA